MDHLTDDQRRILTKNSNVLKVTKFHLVYKPEFKIKAVELYIKGISPDNIFIDAGIDISFFKERYTYYQLKNWKKIYKTKGKNGLMVSERGKKSTGRPKKDPLDEMTIEEMKFVIQLQAQIIDEIKKMRALAKKDKKN
jgi:transposase